jgi:hypothetical protein
MAVSCLISFEDETTQGIEVEALSMRGAQRELTGFLIDRGYSPVGRWEAGEPDDDEAAETVRMFRVAK